MKRLIEDYAIIGDLQTAALVHRRGCMDWLCLPDFDSPACFAAIVGTTDNGQWEIAPDRGNSRAQRCYRGDSMILETTWTNDQGSVKVIDFMPPRRTTTDLPTVVRIVEGVDGAVEMASTVRFRFDYGRVVPWLRHLDAFVVGVAGPDSVWLRTTAPLKSEDLATVSRFTVRPGERVPFVMTWAPSFVDDPPITESTDAENATETFWREWITSCTYEGRYAEQVHRSLMVLKVLTYRPTGGIVAAPTTSLPEQLGGERNWDYRYCWLRDATFTLEALLGCGFVEEAKDWRHWLLRAAAGGPGQLQPMYTVQGARRMPEWTADWLSGFADSTPVRIGNDAADQFQLDIWGEVLAGMDVARNHGISDGLPTWRLQVRLLDHLAKIWQLPDDGIWEIRGKRRHFVHSKVMAWVGFDRMARAAQDVDNTGDPQSWRATADEIHADVCRRGFDPKRNSFRQHYGSAQIDAATLLIPKVGFLPPDDPRVLGTIDRVQAELCDENGLLRRYGNSSVDGLHGSEGVFVACSFWLVEALALAGRVDEARDALDRLTELTNDVGLIAEEHDPVDGRQLGNFPQAYSHVGLINAALRLREAERSGSSEHQ